MERYLSYPQLQVGVEAPKMIDLIHLKLEMKILTRISFRSAPQHIPWYQGLHLGTFYH